MRLRLRPLTGTGVLPDPRVRTAFRYSGKGVSHPAGGDAGDPGTLQNSIVRMFSGMERNIICTTVSAEVMLSVSTHSCVIPTEPIQ